MSNADLGRALGLGPFKTLVPTVGALIAYPLLLRRYGAEMLGSWALLSSLTWFTNLAEVGFTDVLTRRAAIAGSAGLRRVRAERDLVARIFLTIGVITAAIAAGLSETVRGYVAPEYSTVGFTVALVTVILGATAALILKMNSGILMAQSRAAKAEAVAIASRLLSWIVAIGGLLMGAPLEGLGVGLLLGHAGGVLASSRLLLHEPAWRSTEAGPSSRRLRLREVRALIAESRWFYILNLGFVLREPLVRFIILATLGRASVGAWDIAARLAATGRLVVAGGSKAVFPRITATLSRDRGSDTVDLSRAVLAALVPAGSIVLGGGVLLAPLALPIWLGAEVPPGTGALLVILSAWHLLTLSNVPFHYYLLASGSERWAALFLWVHNLSIMTLLPVARIVEPTVTLPGWLWLVGAVLTQVLLFAYVQSRSKLVASVFLSGKLIMLVLISLMMFALCVGGGVILGAGTTSLNSSMGLLGITTLATVAVLQVRLAIGVMAPFFSRPDSRDMV